MCTMMQPGRFATGGYDHRVHLWSIPSDVSKTTSEQIFVKHTALVHTLLPLRDTSHKLLTAGADCRVNVWDLSSQRVVNDTRVSNPVYHLHRTDNQHCVLLEVGPLFYISDALHLTSLFRWPTENCSSRFETIGRDLPSQFSGSGSLQKLYKGGIRRVRTSFHLIVLQL